MGSRFGESATDRTRASINRTRGDVSRAAQRRSEEIDRSLTESDDLSNPADPLDLFPTGRSPGQLLSNLPGVGPLVGVGGRYGTREPGTPPTEGPENNQAVFRPSSELLPGNAGESVTPTAQPTYEPSSGVGGTAPRRAGGTQRRLRSARANLRIPLLGGTGAAASSGTGLVIR